MNRLGRGLPDAYHRHLSRRKATGTSNAPGASVRAILLGGMFSALIAVGIPYGSMVIQGSRLGLSSATPAAFFLFFILLLTLHLALGAIRRSWALSRGEWLTVFAMMMVATATTAGRSCVL